MWAWNATRSREGRGSKLQRRATGELRPSAPMSVSAPKIFPPAVSILHPSFFARFDNALTVVSSQMCAPSSPARLSKRSSKRLRLTAISLSSPDGRSTTIFRPPIAINSTASRIPCGNWRTRSAIPNRRNTGQHAGFKQSPQTFSRGNFSRSRTTVRSPAAAQNAPELDPAGPPPTTSTSKSSIATQPRNRRSAIKPFQSSYRNNGILHHSNPLPLHDSTSRAGARSESVGKSFDGLVSPNFSHFRNSITDSRHLFAADRLARFRVLFGGWLGGGGHAGG